jgi:hypothetical protein
MASYADPQGFRALGPLDPGSCYVVSPKLCRTSGIVVSSKPVTGIPRLEHLVNEFAL